MSHFYRARYYFWVSILGLAGFFSLTACEESGDEPNVDLNSTDSTTDTSSETGTENTSACGPANSLLPPLNGTFCVGTSDMHFTDDTREEPMTVDTDDVREVMVRLFYPTDVTEGTYDSYMDPVSGADLDAVAAEMGAPPFYASTNPHLLKNAPLANSAGSFPVVMFSPGWGITRYGYTALCEALASRGYVVAALNHTGFSGLTVFPDGRQVPYYEPPLEEMDAFIESHQRLLVDDMLFVAGEIKQMVATDSQGEWGRLDTRHMGFVGHSLGGSTSVNACPLDADCMAAIDVDGTIFTMDDPPLPFSKPLLVVTAGQHTMENDTSIATVWQSASGPCSHAHLPLGEHLDFTDYFLLLSSVSTLDVTTIGFGHIPAEQMNRIHIELLASFLDLYLKGQGSSQDLLTLPNRFPEMTMEQRISL